MNRLQRKLREGSCVGSKVKIVTHFILRSGSGTVYSNSGTTILVIPLGIFRSQA